MSAPGDPATARRCWRTLAENAGSAACEVLTPTPGGEIEQERRLKLIFAGARVLKGSRMSPGEGHCACVAAFAFLDLAAAWSSSTVSFERRAQLAPFIAAGAGAIEGLLDEAAARLRRERADIDA